MHKKAFGKRALALCALLVLACEEPARRSVSRAKATPDSSQSPSDASQVPSDTGLTGTGQDSGLDAGQENPVDSGSEMDSGTPDASPFIGDRDQDGLPDGEDPEPNDFNPLLYSDEFTEIGPDWLFTSVSMKIDPAAEQLRVTRVEPFIREGWIGPRPGWGDLYVRSRIRVLGTGSLDQTGAGQVGLMGHVNQLTPDRYLVCGVNLRENKIFISEHNGGAAEGNILSEQTIPIQFGEWFTLGFDMDGADLSCSANEITVSASSSLYFAGAIGFRSFDAIFDAENIDVYVR